MSIPCQTQTRKYLYNLQMLQPLRFLAPLIFALIPTSVFAADVKVSLMTGPTGVRYHFFDKGDLAFGWETKRPSKTDSKIKFCIPAAFTTTTDTIVGIYSYKGNVYNAKAISKTIGGAILIEGGKFEIFPIEKGAKFTPEFIASLRERRASLFQQYQLVQNKTAASFKDKKKFQMRAIVKFTDGREGVVESFKGIDFQTFNRDLVALGVQDALYTDMGAWDEGWFRLPSQEKVVPIGNDRSKTNKQTNWAIFYQR